MIEESRVEKIRRQQEAKKEKKKQQSIADMDTPVDDLEIKLDSVIENKDSRPNIEDKDTNRYNQTQIENDTPNYVNTLDTIKQKYGISEYNVNKKNYQINVRVPKVMYDKFKEICKEMNASCNDTMNKLISDFIEQCKN